MEPDYWEGLRDPEIFRSLADCINFDVLKDSLVTKKMLTATTADDIQGKVELDERNRCLLQCLLGVIAGMYVFVWVLHTKRMDRAVKLLKADADALPWPPTILQPASSSGSRRELRAFGGSDARLPTRRASTAAHSTVDEASSAEQQVARATHLMQGDRIYNMVRLPRGKCIIINNRDFGGRLETRHGSDVDVHRMMCLFSGFHLECEAHQNLKAKEMEEVLKAAAESEQQWSADCLVVVLMSHGDQDIVFGTDCIPLNVRQEVYPLFSDDNCPALQGKLKLLFVHAWRRDNNDSGTYAWSTSADALPLCPPPEPESLSDTEAVQQERMWTVWDMYIVYKTMPGYGALKKEVIGSWLLSAVFNEHSCSKRVEKVIELVRKMMQEQGAIRTSNLFSEDERRRSHEEPMQLLNKAWLKWGTRYDSVTVSREVYGFSWCRKKFYFNPRMPVVWRRPEEVAGPSHAS